MRVIPQEVDRVDQELKGNRGVVRGTSLEAPEAKTKKTRTMYNLEIELPSRLDREKQKPLDTTSGNKGYIKGTSTQVEDRKSTVLRGRSVPTMPSVVYQTPKIGSRKKDVQKETGNTYVVKQNDTLQKISDKMYGTTKKWKKIYEANKDVLESPDKIKPGQTLVIPIE